MSHQRLEFAQIEMMVLLTFIVCFISLVVPIVVTQVDARQAHVFSCPVSTHVDSGSDFDHRDHVQLVAFQPFQAEQTWSPEFTLIPVSPDRSLNFGHY